ncbi:MAG TPA: MBL fold metallo-hydrolase [Thermomicrobiales bacterium]|nr:MBL fold metallo-hydrolase [Thermomicrobiales bacterium]
MAEIRWFGHNCFRIRAKEATVLTDPVGKRTGYSLPKQTVDIVTLSHEHAGHVNLEAVKPGFKMISGPGEYEMNDTFITGIRTYHDKQQGAELGYNTVYLIELENLKFGHLGDLGHQLSDSLIEQYGSVDVLFVPAGGGPVLPPSEMAELIANISPKMVIPMQYRTTRGDAERDEVAPFLKHLGVEAPQPVEKLVIKPSDLTEQMQVVLLTPES